MARAMAVPPSETRPITTVSRYVAPGACLGVIQNIPAPPANEYSRPLISTAADVGVGVGDWVCGVRQSKLCVCVRAFNTSNAHTPKRTSAVIRAEPRPMRVVVHWVQVVDVEQHVGRAPAPHRSRGWVSLTPPEVRRIRPPLDSIRRSGPNTCRSMRRWIGSVNVMDVGSGALRMRRVCGGVRCARAFKLSR